MNFSEIQAYVRSAQDLKDQIDALIEQQKDINEASSGSFRIAVVADIGHTAYLPFDYVTFSAQSVLIDIIKSLDAQMELLATKRQTIIDKLEGK